MAGSAELSARRKLARLHELLGGGLLAAAAIPGLLAAIDQHSAAVRDILAFGVEGSAAVAGAVLLAGYASGLIDEARARGWRFAEPVDWAAPDWFTARLLGVCALAQRSDEPQPLLGA
ncbi:hypothetical protein FHX82_000787 [Amycolatopsis bartoniae]|uniref:Uncharacterized protein n=1 Tax=Amycolatopsis bartoniae TaxID=941986 RepID=A0A8H9MED9_9PSEU|nr:DUF6401 family natural product biosynthesis protein [Amycolatopsis bartoniae]MBB2933767.1 hypothetical protein [Amycolatopsis bartoniae]TVT10571.1 hypothetical protein FNH07_04900 [Amycolatopsis bartoniae]GHF71872.1 hypothetical protein GCM10017566_51960 [Amycolatopsis bartoniae]